MKKYIPKFLISLFVITFSGLFPKGAATEIITISPNHPYEIFISGDKLGYFVDSTQRISIDNIISNPDSFNFKFGPEESIVSIENPESNYWLTFRIFNPKKVAKSWVLENIDPHISSFELYIQTKDGNLETKKAGYSVPFSIKDYQHKNFTFEIPLPALDTVTYYIKANSKFKNKILLKLHSPTHFASYALNEYYLLGIFYGVLAIMLIYNLIIYFSVKEPIYLYYVFYVVAAGLVTFTEDGLGFQYIWPKAPELNYYLSLGSPLFLLLTFTLYSLQFLKLKEVSPMLYKTLIAINVVYFCYFLLNIFIFQIAWNPVFFIVPFSLIYLGAILSLKKGNKSARFFILAYSFVITSLLLLILRMTGISYGGGVIIIYSFNISLVLEIVIFSYALADRIRMIKEQEKAAQLQIIEQLKINESLKDEINRELESKVLERTKELAFANEQMKIQAEEIKRMNQFLQAENIQLEGNVKELTKARVLMKEVDFAEFSKIFPDKDSCLKYLYELKWKKGFVCKKCSNDKYFSGKDPYSKRCTKCGYNESATAYTIFHKCKFPINKAFYMLFLIYANKEKITSPELSQILDLRQSTCWNFSKKIYEIMKSRKKSGNEDDSDGWSMLVLEPDAEGGKTKANKNAS